MSTHRHLFVTRPVHGDLSPLGIRVRKSPRNATFQMEEQRLWKEVGSIFVYSTGRITVAHVADATPREIAVLTGHAEEVWAGTVVPSKATAWFFKRQQKGNYWYAHVSVPADTMHDQAAAEIEAVRMTSTLASIHAQTMHTMAELFEEAS